jgi:hypothetical protein
LGDVPGQGLQEGFAKTVKEDRTCAGKQKQKS